MLFNSLDFAIFLPVVFLLYWFVFAKNLRGQNLLIVVASYIFYGWWDWRFLGLIIFSSACDYSIGFLLGQKRAQSQRKLLLAISLILNLGLLGFFKYFNFFIDNFASAFSFFGNPIASNSLDIILPVGISFYTFQTLSYTIDVYRGKLEPTKNLISFFAFVSFFPQLVAGPIERASHLVPQFFAERRFEYHLAVNGCRQILWGLVKKVVIADQCAIYANSIFNNSSDYSGSTLVMGALFFTFQIYGDFSGYSDIAIGTSRLFGFDLQQNFATPYFSRDIAEFWRRWHISLSTWFRDYLYIPLGGSRGGRWMQVRNTFIIFVVSGFWHGANWTFIFWGFLNAIYFLPLLLAGRNRRHIDVVADQKILPNFREAINMLVTFSLTVFAWIFFRAENLKHAFSYIQGIFTMDLIKMPGVRPSDLLLMVALFLIVEWAGRRQRFALESFLIKKPKAVRWAFYLSLALLILIYSNEAPQEFIYFQF
ncbi:MBOAT family O-acyltransferase [Nonlabens xiamenensis]|uniref:MBOAT family O-acyltransferase n=1 Tax=Nonlabens xiamenensis TaxID=2341043 RepID=UPI000F613D20|nr:MBOAT family O-acyltransferase [Nonlabens xiamenensis]